MLYETFQEEAPDANKPLSPQQHYTRQAEIISAAYIQKLPRLERHYQKSSTSKLVARIVFPASTVLTGAFLFAALLNPTINLYYIIPSATFGFISFYLGRLLVRNISVHKIALSNIQVAAEELRQDLAFNWVQARYNLTLERTENTYRHLFKLPNNHVYFVRVDDTLITSMFILDEGFILTQPHNVSECEIVRPVKLITNLKEGE